MNGNLKRAAMGIGILFALFLVLGVVTGAMDLVDAVEGGALFFCIGMGMLIVGRLRQQLQKDGGIKPEKTCQTDQERFGLNVGLAMTLGIGAEALLAFVSDGYTFRGYGVGFGMLALGVLTLVGRVLSTGR